VIDQAALDALDSEVHAEVEDAVKFADESRIPIPTSLHGRPGRLMATLTYETH